GLVLAQEQAPPPRPQAVPGSATPAQVVNIGIGATKTLQMRGGFPIATIENSRDDIARVVAHPSERNSFIVTGLQAGTTYLKLTAANAERTVETMELHVTLDVEYLRQLILQATPGSNIQLIPGGSSGGITTLIVAGSVTNPEDINVI